MKKLLLIIFSILAFSSQITQTADGRFAKKARAALTVISGHTFKSIPPRRRALRLSGDASLRSFDRSLSKKDETDVKFKAIRRAKKAKKSAAKRDKLKGKSPRTTPRGRNKNKENRPIKFSF